MKVNHDSMIGRNESIKVEKKFRISGCIARTVYGDTKEELVSKIKNHELIGDYNSLQEYRNNKWVTIGKFVTR